MTMMEKRAFHLATSVQRVLFAAVRSKMASGSDFLYYWNVYHRKRYLILSNRSLHMTTS